MTNYEKIMQMNSTELALFLHNRYPCENCIKYYLTKEQIKKMQLEECVNADCHLYQQMWLESELTERTR